MSEPKFIEDLNGRELAGRLLEIWEGRSGLAPFVEEQYRNLWREQAGKEPKIEPCRFHGNYTGETIECAPCGPRVRFKVYECSHPKHKGICTLEMADTSVPDCKSCHWKNRDPAPDRNHPLASAAIGSPTHFDHHNLYPSVPGHRFNSSIMPWRDGYLHAFRNGWSGSEIYLHKMDRNFNPIGDCWKLELFHSEANYGREDPRLFMHRDVVHISYTGVVGGHTILHTNVLYARLDNETLQVAAICAPRFEGRNLWEKNWQFFEYERELYASYTLTPHRVLRVEGETCTLVYETFTSAPILDPWCRGEIRGGAAPVLVGDEWYCFYHARFEDDGGHRRYFMGLLTFDREPPFRVRRITLDPLMAGFNSATVVTPWKLPFQARSDVTTAASIRPRL